MTPSSNAPSWPKASRDCAAQTAACTYRIASGQVAHTYISLEFAIATFIPGISWGWLFQKQRSLVGVSVSHALIGLWIVFILNFRTALSALGHAGLGEMQAD